MNAFALVAGLAGELAAAAKSQKQSGPDAEQGSIESWMSELNAAYKRSGKPTVALSGERSSDEKAGQPVAAREETAGHPEGHGLFHLVHAVPLHPVASQPVSHDLHTAHGHPIGSHPVAGLPHPVDFNGHVHHGLHASGVVQLHGLNAELHHAATHAVLSPAAAQAQIHSHAAAAHAIATDLAQSAIDSQGFSASNALTALLQASLGAGQITEATVRIVRADETGLQPSVDVAGATRRKLFDAMEELGAASGAASGAARQTGQERDATLDEDGLGEVSAMDLSDRSGTPPLAVEALSDRPVAGAGDLGNWMLMTDRAPGQVDVARGAETLGAVNADLDWMAILDQQVGLSRLREADQLRLDVQLQGNERLALEASLVDGVLTVRLGAREDGGIWIAPEQMDALKASLQAASNEVQDVVFEQSADLGPDTGADANGDQRSARSSDSAERNSTDTGGRQRSEQDQPVAVNGPDRRVSEGLMAEEVGLESGGRLRVGRPESLAAGSVSLRA